jgi:ribosomal protein L28
MFRPNVQRVTAVINGHVKKVNVCTKCMKAGKVTRAVTKDSACGGRPEGGRSSDAWSHAPELS